MNKYCNIWSIMTYDLISDNMNIEHNTHEVTH